MFTKTPQTNRERFLNLMEYKPVDRVPNWEVGVWPQTIDRWESEGFDRHSLNWDWFTGERKLGMDAREFFPLRVGMIPDFGYELLEKTDRYELYRDHIGIVHKALIEGTSGGVRLCMDQYISFPVESHDDFKKLKFRYNTSHESRYPPQWREIMVPRWKNREHVLVLGQNCSTTGFYWRAREWMGTENLSYALYDDPALVEDMMEFTADITIEVTRPALMESDFDYVFINEDMAMKSGPLISPDHYKKFISPHMRRLVDFFKQNGVRYVIVDTDGNSDALIPALMDCGVDAIWPMERASDMDPIELRRKYGRDLRLWGGIDKMEIAKGRDAIDAHLRSLYPLVEDGGFIPTIDHLMSPEISWADFQYFMERKNAMLRGEL